MSTSAVVSEQNSLVGSSTGDQVGSNGVTALTNNNFIVRSLSWDAPNADPLKVVADVGAVTWGNGSTGSSGAVSIYNSILGRTSGEQVGSGGITALSSGNYVVSTTNYTAVSAASQTTLAGAGAVWLGNGAPVNDLTPKQLASLAPAGTHLTLDASRNITVNNAVTVGGELALHAGNTITLNAALTSTQTSNSALVLAADQSFVNNTGVNALNTPNGHRQIWEADPAANTVGGLA
jgi:hypothetical protein